jgi:hypothetical protein
MKIVKGLNNFDPLFPFSLLDGKEDGRRKRREETVKMNYVDGFAMQISVQHAVIVIRKDIVQHAQNLVVVFPALEKESGLIGGPVRRDVTGRIMRVRNASRNHEYALGSSFPVVVVYVEHVHNRSIRVDCIITIINTRES